MFIVPNYISTVSYKVNTPNSRTYISNEKDGFSLLLENESSDLFFFLLNAKSDIEITNYIKKHNLEDDFEPFISQLEELGLLFKENEKVLFKKTPNIPNSFKIPRANEEELKQFQGEMEEWQYKNGYLSDLFIEMTHNCNLNCIHCFQNDHHDKTELTLENIKPVIDEAIKLGLYKITISGGECTLAKDFINIVRYIREKRLQLTVYTNGLFLYDNPDVLEELVSLYPHLISLSLYSMNPNIHDKITGVKGSHEKTLSIIKTLKEKNLYVSIKCFLLQANADEHQSVIDFAKQNGMFASIDVSFLNNEKKGNENVQITNEQLKKLMRDENSLLYIKETTPLELDERFFNRYICKAGHNSLTISPNLDVIFCPAFNIVQGNLKDKSLYEIWKSEKSEICKTKCQKDLTECYKEEYCKFCTYCPSFAIAEGNYLKRSKSLCRIAKLRYEAYTELDGN